MKKNILIIMVTFMFLLSVRTAFSALDYELLSWDGTVNDIDDIRCDGLVEYSYEKNGENVWGKNGSRFDISYSTSYCDEHNNAPDNIPGTPYKDWNFELSPKAQRGGYGNSISSSPSTYVNTYMNPSIPKSPTTTYSIISGISGSNGGINQMLQ